MNWTMTKLSLALQSQLQITSDPALLASCTTFIITVPTDINPDKSPNLEPLITASLLVGKHLKKGDLVIYESTTYPGCTEEGLCSYSRKIAGSLNSIKIYGRLAAQSVSTLVTNNATLRTYSK
jgi:UDP-N-acetyl-D-galactosamine dehydrogenase